MTTFISVRAQLAVLAGALVFGLNGAQAQSSVNIGLLAPFSGPWAEHGKNMRDGTEMAVEGRYQSTRWCQTEPRYRGHRPKRGDDDERCAASSKSGARIRIHVLLSQFVFARRE
jgi:hypothetical protein